MANNCSLFLADKILDHIFQPLDGTKSYRNAHLYFGLSTANPGSDASGLAEPVGNGYARVACESNAFWTLASAQSTHNASAITFPAATGGGWGTVTHGALFDASAAGNMLAYGPLSASKLISSGDIYQIAAGQAVLSLT